jgi:hypothetical protein
VHFNSDVGGAGNSARVELSDTADTLLGSFDIDCDATAFNGAAAFAGDFTAPVALAKNTAYRLTIKPLAAANIQIWEVTVDANAVLDGYSGGAGIYHTENPLGIWSDVSTARNAIGLIIDGIDDGSAGAPTVLRNIYLPILPA